MESHDDLSDFVLQYLDEPKTEDGLIEMLLDEDQTNHGHC